VERRTQKGKENEEELTQTILVVRIQKGREKGSKRFGSLEKNKSQFRARRNKAEIERANSKMKKLSLSRKRVEIYEASKRGSRGNFVNHLKQAREKRNRKRER